MGFITVPQNHCILIERFGKFRRVKYEGLHLIFPWEKLHHVDSWSDVANKKGFFIELTEQQILAEPQKDSAEGRKCQTKEGATITAKASVYWQITDPVKAVYDVDNLPSTISDMALNALRAAIGSLELDKVFSEREWINGKIKQDLAKNTDKWGAEIIGVEVQELRTEEDTRESLDQEAAAERQRQAKVLRAKGEAEAMIKKAEAEKEAAIAKAEGRVKALTRLSEAEANYLKQLKKEIDAENAAKVLIAQKFISGFETISGNKSDKVFLPNNFQGLFTVDSMLGKNIKQKRHNQ